MSEGIANVDVPEIEITPEMIRAGLDELYGHPILEPSPETMAIAVEAVFRRMMEVQRISAPVF